MLENNKCRCPLCKQVFTPENGDSPEEHIAKGIIRLWGEIQDMDFMPLLPCPRCGRGRIRLNPDENAISWFIDVYICPECGDDEALRERKNDPMPLPAWHIVSETLKSVPGIKCTGYIRVKDSPYPLCDNPVCAESAGCNISVYMDEGFPSE